MSINLVVVKNNLILWGATYIIRDQIESLGGKWDSKLSVWKLPLLDVDATRKKLNEALFNAKTNIQKIPSVPQPLSIRRAKSIYSLPKIKPTVIPYVETAPVKEVEEELPEFLMQSIAEEITEALAPIKTSSRRSSYGSGHILTKEILSPESALRQANEEVYLTKKKLTKFGSIQYGPSECAKRGQRGIEEACRALLAVEDHYKKVDVLDEAIINYYLQNKIN